MPAASQELAMAAPEAPERPALDEVMLAMDIVDTLRHDEVLAAEALGDAEREAALVAQVRRTYAQQGIEVSEQLVADAVRDLRERRFQYTPPRASLQVALARVYVTRSRWAPKLGALALVVVLVLGTAWTAARVLENLRFGNVAEAVVAAQDDYVRERERAAALLRRIEGFEALPPAVQARNAVLAQELQAVHAGLAALPPPLPADEPSLRAIWLEQPGRIDAARETAGTQLANARATLARAGGELDALAAALQQRAALQDLAARVAAAGVSPVLARRAETLSAGFDDALGRADYEAAAAGHDALAALAPRAEQRAAQDIADIPAAQREAAQAQLQAMDAALLAGDAVAFDRAAQSLQDLRSALAASYTLRIVNREGVRSGLWRHPDDNRNARNYYIVVDAIGADGQRMAIEVRNEETGRIERASTFAVRVPEAVYERVKADKLDNGLIDDDLFGRKRAGELEPRYEFEVAGGVITRW